MENCLVLQIQRQLVTEGPIKLLFDILMKRVQMTSCFNKAWKVEKCTVL
jgi:hypothetical protein